MGFVWETSFWVFFVLTVLIAGGAAFATGRAHALGWQPYWLLVVYVCLLGMADRFLHWGLFLDKPLDIYKGNILSVQFYLIDTLYVFGVANLAYRLTRARQMATQYSWLYQRTGPFTWRTREASDG